VLASVLLLSGCGGDVQVDALRADPMAGWDRPGVREVTEHVTEPGTSLGKPRYARVLRILAVRDGSAVAAVLDEMRVAATDAGWAPDFENDHAFGAGKARTVDGETLRLELTVGRQTIGGTPGAVELYVSITAYPA